MDIKGGGSKGMVWIDVDQDKDKCRAFVNTVMKIINILTKYFT
jgi:hypothetical protein